MNRDSVQNLRLDRRLIYRTGWISDKELEKELAALPDVSEKMTTLGEAEEDEESPESPASE
jgi:hypothetical protein